MVRHSLLFLVIALIATIEFVRGFAISVVPGWHTVITPPFMVLTIILLFWLYLLPIGYFILERRNNHPAQGMVTIHLFLTLFFFIYSNGTNTLYLIPNEFLRFTIPLGLFAIGQVFYIAFFINRLKKTSE